MLLKEKCQQVELYVQNIVYLLHNTYNTNALFKDPTKTMLSDGLFNPSRHENQL